ncbi:phosphatase PAP2 family protein [Mesoplasma coleopterae]|uniref:Phosphatidic acid phosphatase type 2/haloperoxidase domain-containing protein n=1 Tax=Mesoplasma coleopterae TaxID=324078 RepID=A0A2K8P362_9MOLU|nr:phosphatase PAP2 family protein [Mesoplasma coleopterae]ATZ20580.1 hypothetical protein MCOLE_v1c00650 [Mesoplasma coleopterae]
MFIRKNEDKNYLILKILFSAFMLFTIASFIMSSIYDMEINTWFAKGMDNFSFKIIVWIYEEAGMTQSYLFVFIIVAVWVEIMRIEKRNKLWTGILFVYYISWAIFWFTFNISQIVNTTKIDDGFGVGISGWFLESYSIRQKILIVLFLIETTCFGFAFWYLRFKFSNRKDLIESGYKRDAVKAFVAFAVTSLIVYSMKIIFGRPYFYSVDFENIFNSNAMKPEWAEYWTSYGYTIKSWGLYDPKTGVVSGVEYLNWWQINDFFGNIGDLFIPRGSGTAGWWNQDFPSGHMISCFTMLYAGYFFFNEKKGRKINWIMWSTLAVWFIHINMMQYTQIVSRTHWISDTSFSIAMCLLCFVVNGKIIDKIADRHK